MNAKNAEKNIKVCGVICEYNPFHNGHAYLWKKIRETGDFDLMIGIMSGNFTQRGEVALLDKFTRAREAVRSGPDAVLELPLPFALSSAELFARGGVKVFSALPENCALTLAFGAESGAEETFFTAAHTLLNESEEVQKEIRAGLNEGLSLIRARHRAYEKIHPALADFLRTPNNILGTEYAKAILRENRKISLLPIPRKISSHKEEALRENFSSASALRKAVLSPVVPREKIYSNLPEHTPRDLPFLTGRAYQKADDMEYYALLRATPRELALLPDCTEGLEYALKKAAKEVFSAQGVIAHCVSPRYTAARIRRLLLACALGVRKELQTALLAGNVYFSPLALRKEKREKILSVFGSSFGHAPLVMRKTDAERLRGEARELFELTCRADEFYASLQEKKSNPFATVFV